MSAFGRLVHAEWTKFRSVRGWVVATALAVLAIVGLGLLPGIEGSCRPESPCDVPIGPGGELVADSFSYVHRPLTGDGSVTVRVASLTGRLPDLPGPGTRPGLAAWAKAGLLVKDGTKRGSSYAAVMLTGSHGVRLQHDFTHDLAGRGNGPWLRLTRSGDSITGEESADGVTWTVVGTVRPAGLPATVQIGLFVTSPDYTEAMSGAFGTTTGASGGPSQATAVFDRLATSGGVSGQEWAIDRIGPPTGPAAAQAEVGVTRGPGPNAGGESGATGDGFTVTGSGNIAPVVSGAGGLGTTVTQTLVGTFFGLLVMVVVGALSATAEYRRGLIRTTLVAGPRRGRTFAAKAVVIGGVTFVAGLIAAGVVVPFGQQVLRGNGVYVLPASTAIELRLVVGTAALLAAAAVFGLALGTLIRRSAPAVAVTVVAIVLPYLLAMIVLPEGAAEWLLRVTPAAAFAVQQSTVRYAQVDNLYTAVHGYFPLSPWAGLAVLAAWTSLAAAVAVYRFRRRDA